MTPASTIFHREEGVWEVSNRDVAHTGGISHKVQREGYVSDPVGVIPPLEKQEWDNKEYSQMAGYHLLSGGHDLFPGCGSAQRFIGEVRMDCRLDMRKH